MSFKSSCYEDLRPIVDVIRWTAAIVDVIRWTAAIVDVIRWTAAIVDVIRWTAAIVDILRPFRAYLYTSPERAQSRNEG
jgi:phosphosulfolactate phosphohydrolase-like enzyme